MFPGYQSHEKNYVISKTFRCSRRDTHMGTLEMVGRYRRCERVYPGRLLKHGPLLEQERHVSAEQQSGNDQLARQSLESDYHSEY